MGDVGFSEILVIALVFIVLFGPDKLPQIARDLGTGVRKMRGAMDEIKDEIMKETDNPVSEIKREIENVKKQAMDLDPTAKMREDLDFQKFVENSNRQPPKVDPENADFEGPVSR